MEFKRRPILKTIARNQSQQKPKQKRHVMKYPVINTHTHQKGLVIKNPVIKTGLHCNYTHQKDIDKKKIRHDIQKETVTQTHLIVAPRQTRVYRVPFLGFDLYMSKITHGHISFLYKI